MKTSIQYKCHFDSKFHTINAIFSKQNVENPQQVLTLLLSIFAQTKASVRASLRPIWLEYELFFPSSCRQNVQDALPQLKQ